MPNGFQNTANKFLNTKDAQRLAQKKEEIEKLANSSDGQKIKEMFSRPIISDSYAREHYEKTQSRRSDGMDEKDELHLHLYKRNIL